MSHHYIEFKDVTYKYANGFEALKGVSFRISHGEKVALLGKNGAGKSTLLLHSNGLLLPTSGTVDIGGIPVTKKTLAQIRQTVGLVFQNPDDQLFMPTVEEDVGFGPLNMKLPPEEVIKRVEEALATVECSHIAKNAPGQLSGGQKRRVAIAGVLAMQPSVLVLDEPTSNLDWGAREKLAALIESFMHTCIIASHDLGLIRKLCPRTLVLDHGTIVADRPTPEIFADGELMELLGINSKDFTSLCMCSG